MNGAKCDKAHEVGKEFVIAGCDPPEVFEFVEEPLDQIALLVEVFVVAMQSAAVRPGRDDWFGAGLQNRVVKVFGIVGSVSDDETACEALDQGRAEKNLAPLPRTGNEVCGIAQTVGSGVQLGP